jgi:hypothetical protein
VTRPALNLRTALRSATPFSIEESVIASCIDTGHEPDAVVMRARRDGLAGVDGSQRGLLAKVTGEVAESVAEVLLAELGYSVFWQITTPGIRGVDLLLLAPDELVLALEVKGTLRPGSIPRLTPSRLRQMSRDWLSDSTNPGMVDWSLSADDLYAGVMAVDLARAEFRVAFSHDFDTYKPVGELRDLASLAWIERTS